MFIIWTTRGGVRWLISLDIFSFTAATARWHKLRVAILHNNELDSTKFTITQATLPAQQRTQLTFIDQINPRSLKQSPEHTPDSKIISMTELDDGICNRAETERSFPQRTSQMARCICTHLSRPAKQAECLTWPSWPLSGIVKLPCISPTLLWHCWLGVGKCIQPVEWWGRCWCGYLSGARCRLFAYGPADATASQNPIISCRI